MDERGENASSSTEIIKATDHQCSSSILGMQHQDADINNQVPQRPNFFFLPDCNFFLKIKC
jgi:hypothetical protein